MPKEKSPATQALRTLKEYGVKYTLQQYRYLEKGGTGVAAEALKVDEHRIIKTLVMEDDGKDPFLLSLSKKGKLFVPYDETGWPMENRVGQHCSVLLELCNQYSRRNPERAIRLSGVPRYAEVLKNGVGFYFHDPSAADPDLVHLN